MAAGFEFEPWEPEESVGKLWHAYVSRLDAPDSFPDAEVSLDDARIRLGILFRGLGGGRDIELRTAVQQEMQHRLSWRRMLGRTSERMATPSFDGEALRLPDSISAFPDREANVALYVWLAASAAFARTARVEGDALRSDLRALQQAQMTTRRTLAECPGLKRVHAMLVARSRDLRRDHALPPVERAVEQVVRHLLGGPLPADPLASRMAAAVRGEALDLSEFSAPRGYRPFRPVPLWLDVRPLAARQRTDRDEQPQQQEQQAPPAEDERTLKAKRKESDQAARKDSLVLHKFESILSFAEMLNVNRRVEDNDDENAKKAADDLDEIALGRVPQKARTRIRLHLDLSPEETEFEQLAGKHVYPEWDHRTRAYLPDYCSVLAHEAKQAAETPATLASEETRRRMRRVRRQFEALRPRRVHLTRQIDGEDIDIEAAVEARVELAATGEHDDRVYRASRTQERDLAVSILLDVSRSTESHVGGRQVIDIAREAMIALAWGLDACGDETAIEAFSSLRRERVFMHVCKGFEERMGPLVESRIAGLRPGHYTRLGAAVRHASAGLALRPRQRRLLLVITDGKPNDLDHYEGRHGIEDTHMAVREARRRGQSVFGVTIDSKAQAPFSRIFGSGGYVVIPDPEKLTAALPQLYRHLVSG
jgi:nitric oxide reductase NorD protein